MRTLPVTREERRTTDARRSGWRRALVALVVVVALVVAVRTLPVDRWLLDFVAWVRGAGFVGAAVFVVAYVVACVLFLPASILTLGAGFVYGVAVGVPLVWLAASLGATAAFLVGRTAAREWV